MKRRLLALLMSLVMILSVLPGAAFAEPADSSDVLTYADLADIDSSITIPDGASASEELSVADAVRALLLWTGMSEKQLGTFPADYLALARSMGMISADTDTDAACTLDAYRQMKAVANTMYDALHADKLQPLYMNGMAQPIFPYTTGSVETGYSNATATSSATAYTSRPTTTPTMTASSTSSRPLFRFPVRQSRATTRQLPSTKLAPTSPAATIP